MKKINNLKVFLNFYCKKNNDNIFYLSENKVMKLSFSIVKSIKNFNFLLENIILKKIKNFSNIR